jgi:hypothetical protein
MTSDNQITTENVYEYSLKNSIFEGFNEEQMKTLFSITKEITLEKDCYLMHEGDPAREIFLIIDGQLEITRYDAKHKQHLTIATLKAGDTVGEISLLDGGFRSASACAKSFCHLRSIPFDDLQSIANKDKTVHSIYYHLAQKIGERLRHSNDVALKAMEKQLDEFKTRVTLGNFFVYTVVMLSLFTFSLDGLKHLMNFGKNSSFVTLPLTLTFFIYFFVIYFCFVMKTSNLKLSTFGLTLNNWNRAIFEGVVFTIPFAAVILAVKGFLIFYVPHYIGRPLIEGLASMNTNPKAWWTLLVIYILLVAPFQEFLARGGLQGPLEEFLSSKYKVPLAILVSNLLFSTFHLFISLEIGVLVFIPGLYFGWLYSRTHNLLGVWIAHALVGTIGLSIIGF